MLHIEFSESSTETLRHEEYSTWVVGKEEAEAKLWRGIWVIHSMIPFPAQQGAFEWQVSMSVFQTDPKQLALST